MLAKATAVTAAAALSMALASCSSDASLVERTPDASIAPITQEVTQVVGDTANAALGIVPGPERTDQFGTYHQVSLSDDAPVLVFYASKYDDISKTAYTEEQLAEGQKLTARFVAEYIMDNPAIYDQSDANLETYKAETSGFVTDQYVAEWQADVMAGFEGYATDGPAGKIVAENPGAVPDGYEPGESRYSMSKFELSSGWFAAEDNAVVYEYAVEYFRGFTSVDDRADVSFTGVYRIGVTQDATATWKMTGWSHDIHYEDTAE